MKKILLSTLLLVGLSSFLLVNTASAAEQAMIVFDASGSMWGRVDGQEKIVVARDALKQVVGQWNPETQLGLMAYGHRRKGDCDDIEVLVPISGFDKNALLTQVKGISPKGKTPISRSLQQAADTLRYTEDKATVILISDGKETCDADPCATARELEKQGIDFVAHVIGFNVDKETDAQLSCVAEVTGGQYFSAKNAQALNKAMQTVVKTVQEEAPPPQPKPEPKPVSSKYNVHIKAFETEGGKQVEASHWIYQPIDEDDSKQIESCTSYKTEACKERIPVGEYILRSEYNKFKVKTPFTVTAGQTTELNVIMGQTGKVQITAFETEGGRQVETSHWIYQPIDEDDRKQIESCTSYKTKACKERIPVGEYILRSEYNKFKAETPFTVAAGQTTDLNIIMGQTGKVEIIALESEGGRQVEASHWIYQPIDEDDRKQIESCTSYKTKACKERIPVGEYFLLSEYGDFKLKTSFSITAGQTTKLVINFEPIHISAVGMNTCSPVTFSIIDASGRTIAEKKAPASIGANFVLPEGKYRVEADNDNTAKTVEIDTVTQGKTVRIDFGGKAATQTIVGKWQTNYGIAEIHLDGSQVSGVYEEDNGRLFGEYDAATKTFTGYWVEDGSNERCDSQKDGSNHWGRFKWHFDEALCTFKGKSGYCGKRPDRNFSGSFLRPLGQLTLDKQALIDADKGTAKTQPTNGTTNKADTMSGGTSASQSASAYQSPVTASQSASASQSSVTASQSASVSQSPATDKASKTDKEVAGALAMVGALAKAFNGAEESASQDESAKSAAPETHTTSPLDNSSQVQAKTGDKLSNKTSDKTAGDKTEAQAKALLGLVQAFGGDEEVTELKQGLQMLTGLNDNLSGGVLNIYKQAVVESLPYMQKATDCYEQSDTVKQAQACDQIANQGIEAAAKKLESVVGIKPDAPKKIEHSQWDADTRQATVAKFKADTKEAQLTLTCIDNGATLLEMEKCIKHNGKVEKRPKANGNEEDKALKQLGDFLKLLGE